VLISVGIYSRRRTGTVDDFFVGSRTVGPWLSAFAYGTTYFSAVLFVGYAGKIGYGFGQREIRMALNVSKSQLQRYIYDLRGLEYIVLSDGHINRGYRYRIIYWDDITRIRARLKRHLEGQLAQLELITSTN